MASENNTDSYQAPPSRSNKRATRCNATWSFITGNHVVWWLESYHHCGSTKKILLRLIRLHYAIFSYRAR